MPTSGLSAFAAEAAKFSHWLMSGGESSPEETMRQAQLRLASLYVNGVRLREVGTSSQYIKDELKDSHDDLRKIEKTCKRFPVDCYGTVFNLFDIPPEQPVIATLQDDLNDIYRDISRGLRLFEREYFVEAEWEWAFGFRVHWGRHAASALYAIHRWLETAPHY